MTEMTPEQKANDLVDRLRVILMSEDSDCGDEILCTTIAIQHAHSVADEMLEFMGFYGLGMTDPTSFKFYREVKQVLEKM